MIPGTAIPTTRLTVDDSVQPVKPTQAVTDILSEFRPGERLVAEIQSQLPNGTYRALVAQRDVTLALPFSAKSGDTLELEVVDTEGRLTFAVVNRPEDASGKASVLTTLSRTAQLIGSLATAEDGEVPPALLNGGRPLSAAPAGSELAPLLQKALGQSGLFYEAHQAGWIAGRTTAEALREEPQGRLPVQANPVKGEAGGSRATDNPAQSADARQLAAADNGNPRGIAPMTALPAEITPLVQQQLNALATNVFAWQGIAWPGQKIDWEIVDEDGRRGNAGDDGDETPRWQTTLRLSLPSLGAVDALIGLRGDQVELALVARSEGTHKTLLAGGDGLRRQYEAAGLRLAALGVVTAGDDA